MSSFLLLQEDRKTLPIYAYRDELLQAVDNHQVFNITCFESYIFFSPVPKFYICGYFCWITLAFAQNFSSVLIKEFDI